MGNGYITNPSAQQGEDPSRTDSRGPANQKESIAPRKNDDVLAEGPIEIPDHARPVSPGLKRPGMKSDNPLRDPSGASMAEKIHR